jgi:hypothetical protein
LNVTPLREHARMESLIISCEECTMRDTPACDGCVVTFICDREPEDAVVIDVAEERALRLLGRSGLVPPLRHQRGAAC